MEKVIYFDCETTGLDPKINDIIQIAGIIEIDGVEEARFNFTMQPFSWENISPIAIQTHGMTIEILKTFETPVEVYRKIIAMFDRYITKFDKNDKFIVAGYNVKFDVDFLKEFFVKNGNNYLFSYFGVIKDPLPILNYFKAIEKIGGENLKLATVCKELGVNIENAHDALADIEATKAVIAKVDDILNKIEIKQ